MQMYLSDGVTTAALVKKSHGENPKNWKQEYEDPHHPHLRPTAA